MNEPARVSSVQLAAPRPAPGAEDLDAMVEVHMTISRRQQGKLSAFMASDTWEKAMAVRDADIAKGTESLLAIVKFVRQHHANSTRAMAAVICSWYNGDRVKADLSDLWRIDMHWFEHVMNVMRLCYGTNREPHSFIQDGGRIFEEIIGEYRLEKRRRRAA